MITRLHFLRLSTAMTLTTTTSPLHLLLSPQNNEQHNAPPLKTTYHEPPPNVDYTNNPSVFGQILRGELPSRAYDESSNLLAFQDKYPRAPLHALVIPKQYLPTINSLSQTNLELLKEMQAMGLSLIQEQQPEAYAAGDFMTCFHIPPFNSVDHLHLHVLAPVSEMKFVYRLKYWCGMRWCVSGEDVVGRLEEGLSANPYLC
jgi:diadenosine tetraphosphate (Ap4A) HIT family hydrolase